MANFEMLDPDEQAFAKKPRPIGWFVAGVIFIAALGFVLGVYLPLSQAHESLLNTHEQLAKKSSELDDNLKETKKTLDSTESRRADLAAFVSAAKEKEQSLENRVEMVEGTATNELKIYFKSKLVAVDATKEQVKATIDERILFRPRSTSLSPQAIRPLCGVAKAVASEKEWIMTFKVHGDPEDKKFWETAAERAGSLAEGLETRCGLDPSQFQGTVERVKDEKRASLVEFFLEPKSPPHLRGSDAPLGE